MNDITNAIKILNEGGIVIFPTDTVYGIGCRIDNIDSLKRLYKIRNRPLEKAVLAVVDSFEMANEYVDISKEVKEKLIDKYWPGGLTIVLPCNKDKVPEIARGGGLSLGVRQTNHTVLLELIKGVGAPIVAPSANFAGDPTPKKFDEINKNLISLSDFAIDLPSGGDLPSTVIDCTDEQWKVLRQGVLKLDL